MTTRIGLSVVLGLVTIFGKACPQTGVEDVVETEAVYTMPDGSRDSGWRCNSIALNSAREANMVPAWVGRDSRGYFAVSNLCPQNGSIITYGPNPMGDGRNVFRCNPLGTPDAELAIFSLSGEVIRYPTTPTQALRRYPITISPDGDNYRIFVNTTTSTGLDDRSPCPPLR